MRWLKKKRKIWPEESDSRQPKTLYEFDADFHKRYEVAMAAVNAVGDFPFRRLRFYMLERAARQVKDVPGNACEIGCFRGLSAYLAADMFQAMGKKLTFHLCDSFEGLSAPTANDQNKDNEPSVNIRPGAYACSEEGLRAHLAKFDFMQFHKGWIPAPFKKIENERFCYAHIDVDLFEPTRDAIAFLWPRMNPGGVVVLDDYGIVHYPGAKRAIDSFFAEQKDYFLIDQPAGNAVVIKLFS
jgi:O-methyltransferase